jgi:hypothetical protein
MWHCATRVETGVALVAAILALALVSAIALGMAIIAGTEPIIAANSEGALAAGYTADAGLAIAVAEMRDVSDWSAVLAGAIRSTTLTTSGSIIALPDGRPLDLVRHTNLLNCGRVVGCTDGLLDEPSAERPWGRNNPRLRVFGHASTVDLWGGTAQLAPFHLVVWIGDDPAEEDGSPLVDALSGGDPPRSGSGIMRIRTESFGPRGAHATRTGTILRHPGTSEVRVANQQGLGDRR